LPEGDIALWRRARRRFYWLLTVVLIRLADRVPVFLGRRMCVGLARLAMGLRRQDRRVAEVNLVRAFPELDDSGRNRLLQGATEAMGLNLFDTLAAGRLLDNKDSVVEEPGSVSGIRRVGDVLADLAAPGRGVFVLTGHMGCWELLGGWLAEQVQARGLKGLGVVTGTVRNPPVDGLLQDRRRRLGMTVLPRQEGAGPLLRYLRDGGIVAVLLDQNTRVQNLDIPFFGEPVPTPTGLARLALRNGIPVLPVAIARDQPNNRHVVLHRPPLVFKAGQVDDENIRDLLTLCNAELEFFIRRNPIEWVWFHHRWQ
jgi:KDO2-lipid IV(A) lauroyltransferase